MSPSSRLLGLAVLAVTSAGRVLTPRNATASLTVTPAPTATSDAACSIASSASAAYISANPEETEAAINPSIALRCLNSIPVDIERNIELIDYLLPFVQFQSNLAYLADPPEDYLLPGIDLFAGLLEIKDKLSNGLYKSQYEFTSELQATIFRVKDGHFAVVLPLNQVFQFKRTTGIISISSDGLSAPKLYMTEDFAKSRRESYDPSPLKSIDGIDIVEYAEFASTLSLSQDPDALYNAALDSVPNLARFQAATTSFRGRFYTELPDTSDFAFENGTILTVSNVAVTLIDLSNIETGEALHEKVEIPATTTSPANSSTTSASSTGTPTPTSDRLPGYPYPVEKHFSDWVSGYFLNDSAHADTGVLVLNGFIAENALGDATAELIEFIRVVSSYLEKFQAEGKKRLVIDLSVNGGGFGSAALYLFRQFFPDIVPVDTYRLRATDLVDWIGNVSYKEQPNLIASTLNGNNESYGSWQEIFGPDEIYGDEFTGVIANNLIASIGQLPGLDGVSLKPGTLDPENIIIVTDGFCASACPVFTGWMQRLAGVRTVAIGGRPIIAPMQAMGGTKGGIVLESSVIQDAVQIALNASEGVVPYDLALPSLAPPPININAFTLNTQNLYRRNETETPVHFVYEAANCRLFHTADTALNITNMWTSVADVAWANAKCVPGSTVNEDGTIGDTLPELSSKVYSTAKFSPVPGGYESVGPRPTEKRSLEHLQRKGLSSETRFVDPPPMPERKEGFAIF